jgi:uncharacterized DUF497 family protein
MAKFRFIEWLVEWLFSQEVFCFVWDSGNRSKSFEKHRVSIDEIEEVFEMSDALRALGEQVSPAADEPRFGVLGITKSGRHVFVCFTVRAAGIRVISARDMNNKERILYAELCKE